MRAGDRLGEAMTRSNLGLALHERDDDAALTHYPRAFIAVDLVSDTRAVDTRAGSNTAGDHIAVFDAALAQIPQKLRTPDEAGRVAVLVRTDAAGATHQFAAHLAQVGAEFSLGANLGHFDIHAAAGSCARAVWMSKWPRFAPRELSLIHISEPTRPY